MDQWQSVEIDKLAAAIAQAQMVLSPARKEATNPFFHSKYADLPAVWESLHPFREEGIAIVQSPMESPDGYIVLDTQLTHVSGQWMRSRLKMRVAKDDPQGAGSALTYARRYALGCMTGLVTEEDDDGNAASTQPATTATFAQKFPEQAKKIEAKLAKPTVQGDGLVSGGTAAPPGSLQVQDAPASLAPTGAWVVPFGKHKGQPLCDLNNEDVDFLLRYYVGKLKDPVNTTSRYREEWEASVMEIRAEVISRDTAREG